MSDPEFIRNTSPHEISIPIGARNALSKSALASEPAIHRVMTDDDATPAAQPAAAEDQAVIGMLAKQKKSTLAIDETAYPEALVEDHLDETPVVLVDDHLDETPLALAEDKPDETRVALTAARAIAEVPNLKVKISDQLKERLIALKAENDEVSQQLDNLETLLTQQPGKK